jgi:hypothetical protein
MYEQFIAYRIRHRRLAAWHIIVGLALDSLR